MRNYKKIEMIVGLFVAFGLIAMAGLSIKIGKGGSFIDSGYTLSADFGDAGGVRVGTDVMLAGVPIGMVIKVGLKDSDHATMLIKINEGVEITTDAVASVRTKGIIGDRYIRITQGMDEEHLVNGEKIEETESAINIEDLISKYVLSDKSN